MARVGVLLALLLFAPAAARASSSSPVPANPDSAVQLAQSLVGQVLGSAGSGGEPADSGSVAAAVPAAVSVATATATVTPAPATVHVTVPVVNLPSVPSDPDPVPRLTTGAVGTGIVGQLEPVVAEPSQQTGQPSTTDAKPAIVPADSSGALLVTPGSKSAARKLEEGAASATLAAELVARLDRSLSGLDRSFSGIDRSFLPHTNGPAVAGREGTPPSGSRDRSDLIPGRRHPGRPVGSPPPGAIASPTLGVALPLSASLSTGAATGTTGSGTSAPAAALLTLMAAYILVALLPGRLALDVFPWQSAFVAFRLERPG